MNTCLKGTTDFLYADDTVPLCTGYDLTSMSQIMQNDLNYILNWCVSNKLTIN